MTTIPSDQQLQQLLDLAQDAEQAAQQMSNAATSIADKWEQRLHSSQTEMGRSPVICRSGEYEPSKKLIEDI